MLPCVYDQENALEQAVDVIFLPLVYENTNSDQIIADGRFVNAKNIGKNENKNPGCMNPYSL